jgi:xanthine dehydrogenase accessory factor
MEAEPDPLNAPTPVLYDRMRDVLAGGTDAALATVVDVEGSAYRRPGAKMLIAPDGEALGAITAGCLEGPVIDLAREVIDDGTQRLNTYDLTDDDEWGLGLGCNGVIDVLVEPLDASWQEPLDALAAGEARAVVTVLASADAGVPTGARAVVSPDGSVTTTDDRPGIASDLLDAADAAEFAKTGRAATVGVETDEGAIEAFVDGLQPPADLLLYGWQRDVHPVARFGREVGFRVTVASGRGGRADSGDFPHADRVVSTRPSELAEHVGNPGRTYAVVMSHSFLEDRLALESLLDAGVAYVGLMGPRKRFEELREEMQADGRTLAEGELSRIATPVGLDLGGGEPAQIALSIVAEALAVKNGREGGRLGDATGPIHPRVESPQH